MSRRRGGQAWTLDTCPQETCVDQDGVRPGHLTLGPGRWASGSPPPACLVVGGSGTLGGGVVQALVERGARVAATFHRSASVEPLRARHPELPTFPLDLLDVDAIEPAVQAAAEALDGLHALICCAGIVGTPSFGDDAPATIDRIDAHHWDESMAVNARGPFLCARAAARHLGPGGAIVLTGSVDAIKPLPASVHHAASNAALGGLVRALAKELGPRGITVNLVAPGLLDAGQSSAVPRALVDDYLGHAALGRRGTIHEAAATIAWLATTNTAVTGQTLVLDGGL